MPAISRSYVLATCGASWSADSMVMTRLKYTHIATPTASAASPSGAALKWLPAGSLDAPRTQVSTVSTNDP